MICEQINFILDANVPEALTFEQKQAVDEHFASCQECRETWAAYRELADTQIPEPARAQHARWIETALAAQCPTEPRAVRRSLIGDGFLITRTRKYRPLKQRPVEETFVGGDAMDDDTRAHTEAAAFVGKCLATDPELQWAYEEAAHIATGSLRPRTARVRAALANPVFAWSITALSAMIAIAALVVPLHGNPSAAASLALSPAAADSVAVNSAAVESVHPDAGVTAIPGSASASNTDPASLVPASAASAYSASPSPTYGVRFDGAFANPVVVLPGDVFVNAGSLAVMPFDVAADGAASQASPSVRAESSSLYTNIVQRLEAIPGIYVAQPIVAEAYAESGLRPGEVAAQLGGRGIVQGRVAGGSHGRVRVTLSLTDAATDDVVWRGTVERPTDVVANIGTSLAKDVVAALANATPSIEDARNN